MTDQPPSDFNALVASLAASALASLQEADAADGAAEPAGPAEARLTGVRRAVDLLEMLGAKTRGNLSPEEARFLEQTATELKFTYVRLSEASKRPT